MKTPLNPLEQDLVVARGKEPRRKREDTTRSARADPAVPTHPSNGCNGTETLASIERALTRLASGTYGVCVSCGAEISLKRLEHNPAVETCHRCDGTLSFRAH